MHITSILEMKVIWDKATSIHITYYNCTGIMYIIANSTEYGNNFLCKLKNITEILVSQF